MKDKLVSTSVIRIELSTPKLVGADELPEFCENFETFAIEDIKDNDWRKEIFMFLRNPTRITDQKTKYKALSYIIIRNELFKKTPQEVLLKCIDEIEVYLAIFDTHNRLYGAHQAGPKMKWLLSRQGVYWLTMLKDCIEFSRGCKKCQKHGGIQHVSTSELHSVIKPWSFRG